MIADTPAPRYYAVILTSLRTNSDHGYNAMAECMAALAALQPGYLGAETAREGVGITVSYWRDLASVQAWKVQADHLVAQQTGQSQRHARYTTRIANVVRDCTFN